MQHSAPRAPGAAPLHWATADQQPPRACQICTHGHSAPDQPFGCTAPAVAGRGRRVPVTAARAHGGACGPEAEHLDFQGLRA